MPSRLWIWIACFTPLFVLPLFNAATMYLEASVQGHWQPLPHFLIQELTGILGVVPILIPLILFSDKLLVRHHNWFLLVPAHAALFVAFAWGATTLMYGLRQRLYPSFGLDFDPPPLAARYWFEARLQLLGYGLFLAVIHLASAWRKGVARERELASARLRAGELTAQADRAQLAALRAQLQPHFLFNALNVISAVVYEDPERADRLIAELAELLRLALAHPQAKTVALRHEHQFLQRYLAVMQARFQERLRVQFEIDEGALDWGVPYLILQPLVENAVKYMEHGEDRPAELLVRFAVAADRLELEVLDNGPGPDLANRAPARTDQAQGGFGLTSVRERLSAVYGSAASLTLTARATGGTRACLHLPCRKPESETP